MSLKAERNQVNNLGNCVRCFMETVRSVMKAASDFVEPVVRLEPPRVVEVVPTAEVLNDSNRSTVEDLLAKRLDASSKAKSFHSTNPILVPPALIPTVLPTQNLNAANLSKNSATSFINSIAKEEEPATNFFKIGKQKQVDSKITKSAPKQLTKIQKKRKALSESEEESEQEAEPDVFDDENYEEVDDAEPEIKPSFKIKKHAPVTPKMILEINPNESDPDISILEELRREEEQRKAIANATKKIPSMKKLKIIDSSAPMIHTANLPTAAVDLSLFAGDEEE